MENKEDDLKVWWIPNPPRTPFEVPVATISVALIVLATLTKYDLYLGDSHIDSNAGGLEVFHDG